MRNPNRNAKALAILSAAAGLALSSQLVSAAPSDDTWVTGTTGNWSVGGNWQGGAAPLAGINLRLEFNGAGASYTATNDVASGVGLFDRLFVNNAGAGNVVLTGAAINNTGAASGTNAGLYVNNTGAGFTDLSLTGSTLYSIR